MSLKHVRYKETDIYILSYGTYLKVPPNYTPKGLREAAQRAQGHSLCHGISLGGTWKLIERRFHANRTSRWYTTRNTTPDPEQVSHLLSLENF